MNTTWKTGAFSKNSTAVAIDETLLDEKVVILLQGKNVFGDQIYTYLRMTLRSLQQLRDKMHKNDNFMPAEYGEVLAAGKGEPSAELKSEMAVTYNMIDVPRPKVDAPPSFAVPQPKLWDD
jgi:Zn-finger domain-containing protein